jgi:Fic family protein/DNA-binding XRE family transcriptional regulator
MVIAEKLKIIKRLSGLSQESLAKELGVSFATLNSWINGKSQPRQGKLKSIDKLLSEYTGLKDVHDEKAVINKKVIIFKKAEKYKDVLRFILKRIDLYDQFILSLTYNTNRIEGSTLTEDETAAVIFRNETIKNKDLIDHLEAKNHQAAIKFLFDYLSKKGKIDEKLILKLHGILMNSIRDDAGLYRRHGVRIVGSNVPTANFLKVPELMKKLIKEINQRFTDTIRHAAYIHSNLEQIHPFSDGNGRVGRLVLSAMLLKDNLPPAVIEIKEKRQYLRNLRKSQLAGDFAPLEDFICDAIFNGFKIIEG